MEMLTLNDGTSVTGHILDGGDGRTIFVYLDEMSINHGFALFSDPEKTSRIIALHGDAEMVYAGYTTLAAINSEYGNCNITMQKGGLYVGY